MVSASVGVWQVDPPSLPRKFAQAIEPVSPNRSYASVYSPATTITGAPTTSLRQICHWMLLRLDRKKKSSAHLTWFDCWPFVRPGSLEVGWTEASRAASLRFELLPLNITKTRPRTIARVTRPVVLALPPALLTLGEPFSLSLPSRRSTKNTARALSPGWWPRLDLVRRMSALSGSTSVTMAVATWVRPRRMMTSMPCLKPSREPRLMSAPSRVVFRRVACGRLFDWMRLIATFAAAARASFTRTLSSVLEERTDEDARGTAAPFTGRPEATSTTTRRKATSACLPPATSRIW